MRFRMRMAARVGSSTGTARPIPGLIDAAITQANIYETVCSRTRRPSDHPAVDDVHDRAQAAAARGSHVMDQVPAQLPDARSARMDRRAFLGYDPSATLGRGGEFLSGATKIN